MRVLTEQEIIDELFQIDLDESDLLFESSSKNKTIISLKTIYESFLEVEKAFHFYLGTFVHLFEGQDNPEKQKELAKVVRKNISNLSRNIGKLDEALNTEPPKVFRDKSAADSYIEKVEDSHDRLSERIADVKNKTTELKKLGDLYENAYYSMKVKIQTFNQKSENQKLRVEIKRSEK